MRLVGAGGEPAFELRRAADHLAVDCDERGCGDVVLLRELVDRASLSTYS
jgi:hypothetical protein